MPVALDRENDGEAVTDVHQVRSLEELPTLVSKVQQV